MQVRRVRITGVSQESERLTAAHAITHFNAKAAGLEVRIKSKLAVCKLQNYMIAANRIQRDGNRASSRHRNILRYPVFNCRDNRIGYCENFDSVTVPIRIDFGI